MSRNSKLLRWLSSSLSRGIRSSSMTRDFLSLSRMLIALPYLSTRRASPLRTFRATFAFRALHHHWKVLFSQELTSFPKNRAELRCRASRRARDTAVVVVVDDAGGCMQFCKLELNLLRRERGQIRSSRGKCLAMASGKWGSWRDEWNY